MHNVKLAAKVTRADGTIFFAQTNEWNGIDDATLSHFKDYVARSAAASHTLHTQHQGADDHNLNTELSGSIDGAILTTISETGVSYRAVVEFEKHAHEFLGSLIKLATDRASEHAARKQSSKGTPQT